MIKHSLETQLEAVKNVLELGMSTGDVARSLNITRSIIQKWVSQYKEHGIDGLTIKPGNYSGDFKISVIEYMYENNENIFRTAVHFRIPSRTTVRNWERIYREEGPEALKLYNKGRRNKTMEEKIECLSSSQGKICEKDKIVVVTELRHKYKLSDLLLLANIPRSTYYYQLKKINSPDKYEEIKAVIRQIFQENKGRYGYRRITLELRNRKYIINHKTVQKLMSDLGLKCMVRIKKYKSYRGQVGKIASNLLKRKFKTNKPNKKWVTDVTEFSILGKKLYLSPILDLYNGEIISYNIAERPTFDLVTDMITKAFEKIPDNTKLILHSDQGWQVRQEVA